MFKNVRYGLVILGILCFFVSMTAKAAICYAPSDKPGVAPARTTCDLSFTTTPTFACGVSPPQTGTYTVTNNTPVTLKIGTPVIINNDALPASSVTITSTTCGPTLAAGASCNITVSLNAAGPFNRILQIGVNTRQAILNSPVITPTTGCNVASSPSTSFTALCGLGTTSTFAVLAGSTITNTGFTVLNGNLGLSPGTSVTGFPPGVVNGAQHIADGVAATAQNDLTTLYNCLASQPCTTTIGTADQSGVTLTSSGVGAVNVYCSGSSILDSGALTLSGDATSVFIFKAGSSLTLNPGASIVLAGGAKASNVFWQVGSSATLGTSSIFNGTITAFSSITMNTGATMTGRALARNAAVTFQTNTINLP